MAEKKTANRKAPAKKKATASGKAKKPVQEQKQENVLGLYRREIFGGVCVLIALLVVLSSLDKSSFLYRFFTGFVGQIGIYILPIGLILCAIALFTHGGRPVTMRVISSLGFAFLVSAISHLAIGAKVPWGLSMFKTLFEQGIQGKSGGVIGGFLAKLFSLLGGKPVGWALCILLLLIALPASVNLTLTSLLRAINNHRDELKQKQREENYKEPAEVLVERVVQKRQERQERQERRRERSRFDFDLPVDDPANPPKTKPSAKEEAELSSTDAMMGQLKKKEGEAPKTPAPLRKVKDTSVFDLPVDDPAAVQNKLEVIEDVTIPIPDPPPAAAAAPAASAAPEGKTAEKDEKKTSAEMLKAEADQISAEIAKEKEKPKEQYIYPSIELLDDTKAGSVDATAEMRENTRRLQDKLACFNIDAQIVNVTRGPSVTMYELQLAQGVRLSKLTGLSDDIALELGASGVRISAIPDKNSMVGIEVPNKQVSPVRIREVIDSPAFRNSKSKISFAVGKDINGNCVIGDISKMPHVLIAGTTGSGKSVCTNSILISLLYKATPEEVKLIVIDPKMVEFGIYNGIPHLLIPVVTDAKKAAGALQWAVTEMMRRYRTLSEAGVRDIESYNKQADKEEELEPMPKLVVVIDELADLMLVAGKEVEEAICRIAQMGRAAGVHLVIATQRPSADVITGLMKANIPSRIALVVSSAMESRIIIDSMGAEKLIGKGDMLYAPLGQGKKRVQGCYIDETEVLRVIEFVKAQGSVEYSAEIQQEIDMKAAQSGKGAAQAAAAASPAPAPEDTSDGDELLPAAVDVIFETGQASVSMLQRRLKLGYARAARIVDEMEEKGIVGPFEGSKPRQMLITKEQWEAMKNGASAPETDPLLADIPVEDLID